MENNCNRWRPTNNWRDNGRGLKVEASSQVRDQQGSQEEIEFENKRKWVSHFICSYHETCKESIYWAARNMSVGLSRDGKTSQNQMFPVLKVQRGISHQTLVLKARVDGNLSSVCLDLPFLTVTWPGPSVTQEVSASPTTSGPKWNILGRA